MTWTLQQLIRTYFSWPGCKHFQQISCHECLSVSIIKWKFTISKHCRLSFGISSWDAYFKECIKITCVAVAEWSKALALFFCVRSHDSWGGGLPLPCDLWEVMGLPFSFLSFNIIIVHSRLCSKICTRLLSSKLCVICCTQNIDGRSRAVKILGFQMKVLVALVTDFNDYIVDSISSICQLISIVYR